MLISKCLGVLLSSAIILFPVSTTSFDFLLKIPNPFSSDTWDMLLSRGHDLLHLVPVILRDTLDKTNVISLKGAPEILSEISHMCATTSPPEPIDPNVLQYILMTDDNREVRVPLSESVKLWQHPNFKQNAPVVMVITGWNTHANSENTALSILHAAYRCRGGYNFVNIDMGRYLNTWYVFSALNTDALGLLVGKALVDLLRYVRPEDFHLIGHSLGAQISGKAGHVYRQSTGRLLRRITGLDPANPCFPEGKHHGALCSDSAQFVDVIHTNAGGLGQQMALGHADFYPNGRENSIQPGCLDILCSHSRAYELFAESVYPGHELNFMAAKCNDISAYKKGACTGETVPMGFLAIKPNSEGAQPKGTFVLLTRESSPYGLKAEKAVKCSASPIK